MKLIEDGFFKRNKKILLIALVIFIISAIAGMVITNVLMGDEVGQITSQMSNLPKNETNQNIDLSISSFELFIHNITANIIIILGGILFSVISVLITVYNGVSIGSPFGADLTFALVAILPHSVFEYTATILSLAAAFLITQLEIEMIRNRNFRETLKQSETKLKDILTLVIATVILLVIAAIIEGHITPLIAKSFFGL